MLTMRAIDENGKWMPKSRKVYDLDENGERIKLPSGRWKSHERYVLHHFLGAETCAYGTEVMRLFLLGAIHRVFRPGCKFELMLCLVGGQGAGKSTFFRFLACKDEWFSDDLKASCVC